MLLYIGKLEETGVPIEHTNAPQKDPPVQSGDWAQNVLPQHILAPCVQNEQSGGSFLCLLRAKSKDVHEFRLMFASVWQWTYKRRGWCNVPLFLLRPWRHSAQGERGQQASCAAPCHPAGTGSTVWEKTLCSTALTMHQEAWRRLWR